MLSEELADLLRRRLAVARPEADVSETRHAVPIDEDAGRHPPDLELLCQLPLWIEAYLERRPAPLPYL